MFIILSHSGVNNSVENTATEYQNNYEKGEDSAENDLSVLSHTISEGISYDGVTSSDVDNETIFLFSIEDCLESRTLNCSA